MSSGATLANRTSKSSASGPRGSAYVEARSRRRSMRAPSPSTPTWRTTTRPSSIQSWRLHRVTVARRFLRRCVARRQPDRRVSVPAGRMRVEAQVLIDDADGVDRRDDVVAIALDGQQRNRQDRGVSRGARLVGDARDVIVGAVRHDGQRRPRRRRRAAGQARMHENAADESRIAQSQHRRECAAGGQAGDPDALALGAVRAPHRDDLRRDDRRLAAAARRCCVSNQFQQPHALARWCLARHQHQPAFPIRKLGDARRAGELLRRLPAAVTQDEKRRAAATAPSRAARRRGSRAPARPPVRSSRIRATMTPTRLEATRCASRRNSAGTSSVTAPENLQHVAEVVAASHARSGHVASELR